MKNYILILFVVINTLVYGQNKKIPTDTLILNESGTLEKMSVFYNNGKPIVIDFWATYCKPCIIKYNTLKEKYKDWQDETGVKIVIVSIDNEKRIQGAKDMKEKYQWPFELYLDPKGKFLSSLSQNKAVPQTFFFNGNLELTASKSGAKIFSKESPKDNSGAIDELYGEKKGIENFECDLTEYKKKIIESIKK